MHSDPGAEAESLAWRAVALAREAGDPELGSAFLDLARAAQAEAEGLRAAETRRREEHQAAEQEEARLRRVAEDEARERATEAAIVEQEQRWLAEERGYADEERHRRARGAGSPAVERPPGERMTGPELYAWRKARGLTQVGLAARLGVSQSTIAKAEAVDGPVPEPLARSWAATR